MDRIKSFRQCADLIYLDQYGIGRLQLDSAGKSLCICHKQVISHQLDSASDLLCHLLPAIPVILCQAILNGRQRIHGDQLFIIIHQFL